MKATMENFTSARLVRMVSLFWFLMVGGGGLFGQTYTFLGTQNNFYSVGCNWAACSPAPFTGQANATINFNASCFVPDNGVTYVIAPGSTANVNSQLSVTPAMAVNADGLVNVPGNFISYNNLVNNGTMWGTGTYFFYSTVNNAGYFQPSGAYFLQDGAVLYNLPTGAVISTQGTHHVNSTIVNQGTYTNTGNMEYGNLLLQKSLTNNPGKEMYLKNALTLQNTDTKLNNSGYVFMMANSSAAMASGTTFENFASAMLDIKANAAFSPSAGTVNQAGTVTNLGIMTLSGSHLFNNSGTFNHNGGTVSTGGSAHFNNTGTLQIAAPAALNVGGMLTNAGAMTNNGAISVTTGGFFTNNNPLAQNGTLQINGGTWTGAGAVNGDFTNVSGTVAPKGASSSTGTLPISGDFSMQTGCHLAIEIASATDFDKITVGGTAVLGGTISVALLNGFVPAGCQEFEIMTFSSATGSFSGITGGNANDWQIIQEPTKIKLRSVDGATTFVGGGGNNLWSNVANWAAGCPPQPGTVNGSVTIAADCEMDVDVVMNADLTVNSGKTFTILSGKSLAINAGKTLANHGTLTGTGQLTVAGTATSDGDVQLINASLAISAGGAFTNSALMTVGGTGGLLNVAAGASLTNGGTMHLSAGSISMLGTITNQSGRQLFLTSWAFYDGTILNSGELNIGKNITFTGICTNAAGANFQVFAPNWFQNDGIFSNAGTITINAGGNFIHFPNRTLTSTGAITNNGYLAVEPNSTLVNNGTFAQNGVFGMSGTLKGTGSMAFSSFNPNGSVQPGNSAGTMPMTGQLFLSTGGSLDLEIGGTGAGQFDKLALTGALQIYGSPVLNISLINGFVPTACDEFEIMTFSSRIGTFPTVNLLPPAADWRIEYGATSLKIIYGGSASKLFNNAAGDNFWTTHGNWTNCLAPQNVAVPTMILENCTADLTLNVASSLTLNFGKTMTLGGDLTIESTGVFENNGTLVSTGFDFLNSGSLRGSGVFQQDFTNDGKIEPGIAGGDPATGLTFANDLFLENTSELKMQLGGINPSDFDRILVGGTAVLNGNLIISTLPGFTPFPCHEFVLMTFSSQTGTFSTVSFPGSAANWQLIYEPTELKLKYIAAPSYTFLGTVDNSWSNPANWQQCHAPIGIVSSPIILAANCVFDQNFTTAGGGLTINAGKNFTVDVDRFLEIPVGKSLVSGAGSSLVVDGTFNLYGESPFSTTFNLTNNPTGQFKYQNTAKDVTLRGAIHNLGNFEFGSKKVTVETNITTTAGGTSGVNFNLEQNFTMSGAYFFEAGAGGIGITANFWDNSIASHQGVTIGNGARLSALNLGNIEIFGRGGRPSNASAYQIIGVSVGNFGTKIEATGGGSVSIEGVSGIPDSPSGSQYNMGVYVWNGALIDSYDPLDLLGTGGSGPQAHGVRIESATVSCGNPLDITGNCADGSAYKSGVDIENSTLTGNGLGGISITGNGGSDVLLEARGIRISANSNLNCPNGDLKLIGMGGTSAVGSGNHGIDFDGFANTPVNCGGHATIIGMAGSGGGGNDGVRLFRGINATGAGKKIHIEGTGGAGSGNGNEGIVLAGKLTNVSDSINLIGTAGGGNSHGFENLGVEISSDSGSIYVEGTASGNGLGLTGGSLGKTGATGPIFAVADNMTNINFSGNNDVTIRPKTPALDLFLGNATGAGLNLGNSFFQNIYSTGTCTIGDETAGTGQIRVEIANFNEYSAKYRLTSGSIMLDQIVAGPSNNRKNLDLIARTGSVGGLPMSNGLSAVFCDVLAIETPLGKLAPGASPGLFQASGKMVLTDTLEIEIAGTGGAGQPSGHDQLQVSELLTIASSSVLKVVLTDGFVPTAGQTFVIATTGSRSGIFPTLVFPPGFSWSVSYTAAQITLNAIALPIELVDFSAKNAGESVDLNWETASESQNRGFFIERSSDGTDWLALGFEAGKGTTTETSFYFFEDKKPLAGLAFYRLRQVDFDEKTTFSNVVSVERKGGNDGFSVFPNPTEDGFLTLFFDEKKDAENATARLFDPSIRLLKLSFLKIKMSKSSI